MAKKSGVSSSSKRVSGKTATKGVSGKSIVEGKTSKSTQKPSAKQKTQKTIGAKTGCALPVLGALFIIFILLSGFTF